MSYHILSMIISLAWWIDIFPIVFYGYLSSNYKIHRNMYMLNDGGFNFNFLDRFQFQLDEGEMQTWTTSHLVEFCLYRIKDQKIKRKYIWLSNIPLTIYQTVLSWVYCSSIMWIWGIAALSVDASDMPSPIAASIHHNSSRLGR